MDLHVVNARGGWSGPDAELETIDRLPIALCLHLDGAVGPIADPPGQSLAARGVVDEEPVAYVLDAATHDEQPSDEHSDSIPAAARRPADRYHAESRLGGRGGAPGAPARHVHSRISGRSSP